MKERFYSVYMENLKDEVAQVIVKQEKALIGRTVKADLSYFAKGKLGEISGKIKESKEGKFFASMASIKIFPTYIRRFVRRGVTKIDESFVVESSDKKKIRVKPVLITRKKVKGSVEAALRKECRNFINKDVSSQNAEQLFHSIIEGTFQKNLSKKLRKIYPLSFCEIREVLYVK